MAQIKFVQLSQSKYDDLLTTSSGAAISASSLYFTTDTHRVYKGSTLYSNEVRLTPSLETVTKPQDGCLYIITGETNKGDMYIYTNGDFSPVGMNTAKVAELQGKISSNWSLISNNSSSIDGLASRLSTAESTLNTLGNIQGGGSIADALAIKLDKAEFSSYSSLTSSTLEDLRSDIDTNAAAISSNYNAISSNSVAIENVKSSISSLATSSAVTVEVAETATDGYLKTYVIKQGGVAADVKIDIPKDLVVESGSVVKGTWANNVFTEDASGTGTALKLVIANHTDQPVYINTLDLVKDHTGTTVNGITVDISATNEISVSIADGSIARAKLASDVQSSLTLADSAIQTADLVYANILSSENGETLSSDIADIKANIASLSGGVDGVQGLIDAAIAQLDSSAQAASGSFLTGIYIEDGKIVSSSTGSYTLSTGTTNGTISFNGVDVAVAGLGSAAFTDSAAYDAAGDADAVKNQLIGSSSDTWAANTTLNALKNAIDDLDVKIGTQSASALAAANSYADTVANTASTNAVAAANSYTDTASASAVAAASSYTDTAVTSALSWEEVADSSNE